ncbi:MAG: MFS transporter, partial [Liquorilactobacillus hordei]
IVKIKVKNVNRQVANYHENIIKIVKQKMTQAFIKPYQVAMPFAWLMLVTVFIFEKTKRKSKNI